MGETNVLFSIGPLEVTGAVVTMWVIVAVLALLSWLATRRPVSYTHLTLPTKLEV